MSIKYPVIRAFRDKDTKEHYAIGSSYKSDDPERIVTLQEKRFLSVEAPEEIDSELDQNSNNDDGQEIKHVGGGYYELPNGDKVKGKEAAEKALEEYKETLSE
ncbi:TPA: hypothetical protein ACG1DY_005002 [Escherichia coli]